MQTLMMMMMMMMMMMVTWVMPSSVASSLIVNPRYSFSSIFTVVLLGAVHRSNEHLPEKQNYTLSRALPKL
jgi:carbon starvation protein CstA